MNETTAYKSDDVLEIRNPVMMHLILTFMDPACSSPPFSQHSRPCPTPRTR